MFDIKISTPGEVPCPTCGNTIEAKVDSRFYEEEGRRICFECFGKCKKCKEVYFWIEHFYYQGYSDIEICDLDEEEDFPPNFFDKN